MSDQRQDQLNYQEKQNFQKLIDSDDQKFPPMNDDRFNVSSDEDQLKNLCMNFKSASNKQNQMVEELNDAKVARNQNKKRMNLQQTFDYVQAKLSEKSSIENKISAFKALNQKIIESKGEQHQTQLICNWIQAMKILDNHLHQDSHPQILRNMPTIMKFLYENYRIDRQSIRNYIQIGLKASHDQFLKVIQSFLNFVRIDDLLTVFQLLCHYSNLQNPNLPPLLSTIVSGKALTQSELGQQIKNIKNQKANNILSQELLNEDNYEPRDFFDDYEIKKDVTETMNQSSKTLTIGLFTFLIQATDSHMNNYYPILNKLITSKLTFLSSQLSLTLPSLLKNGKLNAVWILDHCLKLDFGQSSKLKGTKNQSRFNFISKLVNQHLFQHLLIILARNRFNKVATDKILNIIILLSKNYKPLDDVYTRYIWKILGLNSKQEKQRQQFFNFVRDILRNQSNFTEQSVHFIFFDVLMALKAEWFSIKIIDCLEMLFMRLNEDLKLISYIDHTYEIQDYDLVGIDKLWYIYFYSTDAKVIKKCKDFLWKLATYHSSPQTKNKLLKQYVTKIINYMSNNETTSKLDLCCKGFDIIDKMMEETQKKDGTIHYVQFSVKNQCSEAIAPKSISLRLPQKCILSNLKQQIGQAINPPNSKIKLLLRGQFLKGQKMTLKDLSIDNGNTIMVIDDEPVAKPVQKNNLAVDETVSQLEQIFGTQIKRPLLQFIVQKMEGYDIERIMDAIMNEEKLRTFTSEMEQSTLKQNDIKPEQTHTHLHVISQKNQMEQQSRQPQQNEQSEQKQNKPLKFSSVLTSDPQVVRQLLYCGSQSNKKRGWETIKSLPYSSYYLQEIKKCCEEKSWQLLFPTQNFNEMLCVYNAHLLQHYLMSNKHKMKYYLETNGGFKYLIEWLRRAANRQNNILLEQITNILVLKLKQNCNFLVNFRKRVAKKQHFHLLPSLVMEMLTEEQQNYIQNAQQTDESFFQWLIDLLLPRQINNGNGLPSANIAELIIYFSLTNQNRLQYVIGLPNNQIYSIIQLHGFEGQYIFLCVISKCVANFSDKIDEHCHKLIGLFDYCFNAQHDVQIKPNTVYVCDLISDLVEREGKITNIQLQLVQKCIVCIHKLSQQIELQPFASLLNLLKASVKKLYSSDGVNQKLNTELVQFTNWLFSAYLFNLNELHKHMRDKNVRKICYEIIQIIGNRVGNEAKLIDSILKIQIKERHKEDDYIDFRGQQYIGLTNLGATCYINSLLQQLYHTKFSKLMLENGSHEESQVQKIKELKNIFVQLSYSIKNVVNPRQFIKNMLFYGQPINTCVQQDATQFLLCLFDYIESQGYQAEVYDVFGGYLCNQITVDDPQCVQQLIKYNKQHFNSLTIDIKGKKNLQQALAYMIKPQTLDGENKYFCQELQKKMKAYRRCYISKMPNILILTLKRFQFDFDSQSRHKLNDYFEFPLELDMHKYSESFLKNKEESSDSKYKLSGILVHSGSAESGHYYSYIKIGEQWFEFNDKSVSEFNIQNNLKNECFGCAEGKKTRSAYMLFYEKVNSNYHGVHLHQIAQNNFYKRQITQQNSLFLKSRLVYDDNFKKLLEALQSNICDARVSEFINKVFNRKKKNDSNNMEMIYYDADDEKTPLMKEKDEFDQFFEGNVDL